MTVRTIYIKNYVMNYVYIKNRMNDDVVELGEYLKLSAIEVREMKKDIKRGYLEKKDKRQLEDRKFKNPASSDRCYYETESDINKSFMGWVQAIRYNELSEAEKEIYDNIK